MAQFDAEESSPKLKAAGAEQTDIPQPALTPDAVGPGHLASVVLRECASDRARATEPPIAQT